MSEENSSEKKHKPSAKKLDQLKKDGIFLRPREYYAGIMLISSLIALYALSGFIKDIWLRNFKLVFANLYIPSEDGTLINELLLKLMFDNFLSILPVLVIIVGAYLLAVFVLGGLQFSFSLIHFKLDRLSPGKNLKRVFSIQAIIDLTKSIIKILMFFVILILFFYAHQKDIISLERIGVTNVIDSAMFLFKKYLTQIIGIIIIIALMDALISYQQYQKNAMMTHQELKDESKETDGNPEIKRRIRQTQHAMSLQRLRQEMPKATVVITNPTHYAVALRYIEKKDSAPVIIAKGIDFKAYQIRQLAIQHAVPIYQAPELARAIYKTGKLGATIHPELYMAVAIVLSYILQLKEYQLGRAVRPIPLSDLQIPEHLRFEQ